MATTHPTADPHLDRPAAAWQGFEPGPWQDGIDVRDFIQRNYTPYEGDAGFLAGATDAHHRIWDKLTAMFPEEREKGIYDVDPQTPATITSHGPGYIDQDNELIVGLQTDAPLKRAIMPYGGWRMVEDALKTYGYRARPRRSRRSSPSTARPTTRASSTSTRRTCARRAARTIITGLPDAYGRGRIIGDYRRVALYGVDALIAAKKVERAELDAQRSVEDVIRDREENAEQIRALGELKEMAASYGYDISRPATTAQRGRAVAVLRLPRGREGAERRGDVARAAPRPSWTSSSSATSPRALLTESQAQELIDDLVIKLRIVRFLRTPEYDALFSGDPTWVTESIGGMGEDGRTLVTRTSFRMLQTLYNLGPAPEPNLTVLWSDRLPDGFKEFVRARCRSTPPRSSTSPTT